jgi:hypothetical protein
MKTITPAGDTVVPAILALEALGYRVRIERTADGDRCQAIRDDEVYVATDPIEVLGLVKLIEVRGWDWASSDDDLDAAFRRHPLLR